MSGNPVSKEAQHFRRRAVSAKGSTSATPVGWRRYLPEAFDSIAQRHVRATLSAERSFTDPVKPRWGFVLRTSRVRPARLGLVESLRHSACGQGTSRPKSDTTLAGAVVRIVQPRSPGGATQTKTRRPRWGDTGNFNRRFKHDGNGKNSYDWAFDISCSINCSSEVLSFISSHWHSGSPRNQFLAVGRIYEFSLWSVRSWGLSPSCRSGDGALHGSPRPESLFG